MSGSRSTQGMDGGTGGGPSEGASAWTSSFSGPARYSPSFDGGAAEDRSPSHGESYAPYANGAAEYTDPYTEEHYGAASYGVIDYTQQYGDEPFAHEQHTAGSCAGESYGYDAEFAADHVAPDFPAATHVGDEYPAHSYDPDRSGDHSRYEGSGYAGHTGGFDGGLAAQPYGQPQAERGHTGLLTKPRPPEADQPLLDQSLLDQQRLGEAGAAAFEAIASDLDDVDLDTATPAVPRARGAQRGPSSGRRKTGWAGRAVQGLVLAALVGGVTAYVAFEKTVNISVDGSVRQIHSFAGTVGAALSSAGVTTGSHDLVTPAPSSSLADNSTITVKYGRPINVTVNGKPEHAWVHAATVGGAMQELGIRVQGARFVSVEPSTPISRSGRTFAVYTVRHVTFLVDGKTDQLDTTAATVQDAMAQAGITLQNQDTASVALGSLPADGETISVMRIVGTTEVKQIPIPYTVTKQSDPNSYVGTTTVVTAGQDGVAQVTYALQIVNGVKQTPKEVSRVVTKQPVAEVEKVGTKAMPTTASGLNWAALANCESGGDPHAVDPSGNYYGLYQFSISTWESLGGSGLPSNASASEQTTRAELLYQRSGAGQWPVCGHFLFS